MQCWEYVKVLGNVIKEMGSPMKVKWEAYDVNDCMHGRAICRCNRQNGAFEAPPSAVIVQHSAGGS